MKNFEYAAPRSEAEVLTLLSSQPGHTEILAGGTDLIPNMKRRQQVPSTLVGLRGIPELSHYFALIGLGEPPPHFSRAAEVFRYNRTVFIAPPWREIFANDKERKQDFAEAVRSYELCVEAYRHWGYELTKSARVRSGALYPILRRMLDEGWLDDGWEERSEITGKRPARRYYKLTTEGAEALGALLVEARQDFRFGVILGGFA